ncbi:tetratricopeptide repeat protein [Sphingomonas sp. BK069]|uniref:tetratricopeptide repeat protein n=1 Tax=Sphingomonas sp. BK069 TaxID=2586979 RepID=UPI001608F93E|nr:tetratricopeptide repeat protein [Sphingomonas sp. BK069]MBB3345816.1 Flp pilus assembly protein TadD [Sphingomonas sp. BK069]
MRRVTVIGVLSSALLCAGLAEVVVPAAATSDGRARVADAARHAERARKALVKRRWDRAVREGEIAVADAPADGEHRRLLGVVYLRAGRFASAARAFEDALTLRHDDHAAALDLALTQVALGQWDRARATLAAHAGGIAAPDRGLALALAGDLPGALQVLMPAARLPEADAKTRQNLAFTLALSGQWPQARALAAFDLPADAVDRRLATWAALAQPRAASDQVAALLSITPASDPGLPVALALVAPAPVATPIAVAAPPPPAFVSQIVPPAAPPLVSRPVPPAALVPSARPAVAPRPRTLTPGGYYLQLGAYENAAVARDGWRGALRRWPVLGRLRPTGIAADRSSSLYRLSVGGVARGDAIQLCRGYRARGGHCFVRLAAGDRPAPWRAGSRLAAK